MPLVIGVSTRDGLVIAGDSRAYGSINDGPPRLLSDHVPRVFRLSETTALAYWGQPLASTKNRLFSVSSEVANTIPDCPPTGDLRDVVQRFLSLIMNSLGPVMDSIKPFGFMFAGYDGRQGKIVTVDLPANEWHELCTTENPGITWQGYGRVIGRILHGVDPDLLREIRDNDEYQAIRERLPEFRYWVPWKMCNIGDAAAIAETLIETTASVQRIAVGVGGTAREVPNVGGPIDVAAVTRSGFYWIKRKKEYSGLSGSGEA